MGQDFVGHLRSRPGEIEDGFEHQNDGADRAHQQRHLEAVRERGEHQRVERPHGHKGLFNRKSRKSPRQSRPRPKGDSKRARSVSA